VKAKFMVEIVAELRGRPQLWLCTPVDTSAYSSIGVRELRSSLAEAVRRAGSGERTVITAHGRPVAQLGPLDDAAPDIERLVSAGSLVPPRRISEWRPPEPVQIWSGVRIDRALRELRG
jgi:prevent-host-death family protein